MMVVIGILAVFALVIKSAWCRFLCPYGALLGLLALLSPVGIQRNKHSCITCEKCNEACPAAIPVATKGRITSPECIGCGECSASCPLDDCLQMKAANTSAPYWLAGAGAIGILLLSYFWASATGHWVSDYPVETFRRFHLLFFKM